MESADPQRAAVGRAAHDLGNLLAVVKGYTFLLGPVAAADPEAAELVAGIDGAVRDIAAVADRLHALARDPAPPG